MNHFTTSLSNWCTALRAEPGATSYAFDRTASDPRETTYRRSSTCSWLPRIAVDPFTTPSAPTFRHELGIDRHPFASEVRGEALRIEHLEEGREGEIAGLRLDDGLRVVGVAR